MNYETGILQTAIMIALIAIWGFWEYREREIRHRKDLLDLRNNVEPETRKTQNWGKVTTTVVTGALLLILDLGGIFFAAKEGIRSAAVVLVLLAELTVVAVLLLMMAARDIKVLKRG